MSEWLGESFLQKNWAKRLKPAKNEICTYKKFVKMTDHNHACNDLTDFEYVVHAMTGNRSYENVPKPV